MELEGLSLIVKGNPLARFKDECLHPMRGESQGLEPEQKQALHPPASPATAGVAAGALDHCLSKHPSNFGVPPHTAIGLLPQKR
jgi:hypothetical protein